MLLASRKRRERYYILGEADVSDPDWWLPLSSYRAMCRAYIARIASDGVVVTFRGARRIYRAARDGTMYVEPGTLFPDYQ